VKEFISNFYHTFKILMPVDELPCRFSNGLMAPGIFKFNLLLKTEVNSLLEQNCYKMPCSDRTVCGMQVGMSLLLCKTLTLWQLCSIFKIFSMDIC
jgi:hypothetical protein